MLRDLLAQNRSDIRRQWAERIVDGYHPRTQGFLSGTTDRFDNPVGQAIDDTTGAILAYLLDGGDEALGEALGEAIEQFVRIRAVQDFTSRDAIGFIFQLKAVLRAHLGREVRREGLFDELLEFESAIDGVALVCFDRFVAAREELFHIQNRSIQRETHKLVERMNRMSSLLREARGEDDEDAGNDNGRDSHE